MNGFVQGMISKNPDKVQLVAQNFPSNLPPEKRLYLDIGCLHGHVIEGVLRQHPDWRGHGIDIEEGYLVEARRLFPQFKFSQATTADDWGFEAGSVGAVTFLSVLHEIYSQADLSKAVAMSTLQKVQDILAVGGRLIIREPAMPDNPDELLQIHFENHTGNNPTDDALATTHPQALSLQARLRKYLQDFFVFKLHPEYLHSMRVVDDQTYELPAWMIGSYLRKRTFTDSPAHWDKEMAEINAPFTAAHFQEMVDAVGLHTLFLQAVYEVHFYGEIKPEEGITIIDLQGNPVEQATRFPSHVYGVFEKR